MPLKSLAVHASVLFSYFIVYNSCITNEAYFSSAVDKFYVNSQLGVLKATLVLKQINCQNIHINLPVTILTWAIYFLFNSLFFDKLSMNLKTDFSLYNSENSYSRKKPTEFLA